MATMTKNTAVYPAMTWRTPITKDVALAHPLGAALITAQIAGLVGALAFMLLFAFLGMNPLYPIQVVGSFVLGTSALQTFDLGAVLMGIVIHQLVIAMVFGFLFAVVAAAVPIVTKTNGLLVGLAVGVVSMIGPYVIYPVLMNAAHGLDLWNREIPMTFSWIAYLLIGASFILFPRIALWLARKDTRTEVIPPVKGL